jgi:outer membrane protein OmpA-like peptidoglycan-associated protein
VGALGHNASVHESFSDVFHVLKGVIPIAVDAQKGRFVMPLDFFWVKLGDDRAIPLNDFGQTSVNLHITESIFTPKVGYRLLDGDRLKIDALGGIRFWYVSQNLTLEPSGLNQSRSQSWVDGLGGMRFIVPLGEKAAIVAAGDAGAGGASLDYQAVGLFTYDFTPKLGLGLGWRYLDVDYAGGNKEFVYDIAQSGALAGLYFNFGGKPPIPPSASCSISPNAVWAGEPVSATIATQNFKPKHTITYAWSATGAKVSGNSTTGTVDTTGLAPGTYTVTGTATDAKEKKNNLASCSASFTVKQPQPPQVSCSANPTTVAVNQPSTVTISATDPQGWPLTYSWTNTGGQMSGSGNSVTVTATNADAGNTITVNGTAADARANLSATCSAQVNVPAVQKCAVIEDWGECTFEKNPKKPWRVDNDCKDVLDKVSLRLQQMPNGKLNVVGYTDQEESIHEQALGSQRSVNVKYYLTTDGPTKLDAQRIQPRAAANKGKATHFYFVPEGNLCGGQLEEGEVVDEGQVQPQSRNAPAPARKGKKTAPAAPTQ